MTHGFRIKMKACFMKERVFWSVYIQRCWWYNSDSVMTTSSHMLPNRRLFWNKSEKTRKIWSWEAEKTIKAMKQTAHTTAAAPPACEKGGDQPRGFTAGPAQAGGCPGPWRTGSAGRSRGTGRPFQQGPAGAADDSRRPTRAPRATLRARGRHGSRAHGEARPFQEYQAQRGGSGSGGLG